jgi:CheY-like chemotaxis protein
MPETQPGAADPSENRVVILCRDPGRRALLEGLVPAAETHTSAVEAVLAVTRKGPRAVVVNLEDIDGSERDLLGALRRARPDVPVYVIVKSEDEPRGRGLVRQGAGDYFVLPTDVYRLPQVLAPAPPAPAAADTAPGRAAGPESPRRRPDPQRLFDAACALAGLAQLQAEALLREGAAVILRGLGAARGCLFAWNSRTSGLDLAVAVGEPPGVNVERLQSERAAAERIIRTGKAALVPGRTPGDALLCVPVCGEGETIGVLCMSRKDDGSAAGPGDRDAATALAASLARLYGAAAQREQFATYALRDPETGLLKRDAFEAYLAKLIGRAGTHNAQVSLLVFAPERGRTPPAPVLGRIGLAIGARLPNGWQGARLSANRFAVVGARGPGDELPALQAHLVQAARAGGLVDLGAGEPRLRASLAEFPKDGADAETLLAAAEERLGAG